MADESVGDRLRRFRRLRGLSQEQLSERAGVRRDYIGSLEASPTKMPRDPDQLKLLAAALGVRLRDLAEPTGWYDEDASPDADWERLLMADDRLTDEAKQSILYLGRAALADQERKRQAS